MITIPSKLARLAVIALSVGASSARADVLDTSMPLTVAFGPSRGAAPSERIDPQRTGRARTRLPEAPVELWRRHVSGNVEVAPAVDEAGNIIVALSSGEVVKLSPDARELWRFRTGGGSAVASPTLLNDGTIAVITSTGSAWGLAPSGAVRFFTPLGVSRRDVDTAPLALAEGGLLVAAGSALVELGADGSIRARASLEDRPLGAPPLLERASGAVVEGPRGALVTAVSGNVYRFRPPAPPLKIGSFGGVATRGAMLADARTLVAVVDGRRLVALDLPTGTAHVRSSGVPLDSPPALTPSGLVVVSTQLGLLIGLDAAGNEKFHASLEKAAPAPTGVIVGVSLTPAAAEMKPSPPVVIDPDGRVAYVRVNGRAGLLTGIEGKDPRRAPGKVILSERVCAAPIAVVPAGDKRVLIACRDGGLWMYGE